MILVKGLPRNKITCFQKLLTPTQYKMLEILIMLLQFHKTVTIEKLAKETVKAWRSIY